MNKTFESAIEECLSFHDIEPTDDVEYNCGSVWFIDKNTGKKHYVLFGECNK